MNPSTLLVTLAVIVILLALAFIVVVALLLDARDTLDHVQKERDNAVEEARAARRDLIATHAELEAVTATRDRLQDTLDADLNNLLLPEEGRS